MHWSSLKIFAMLGLLAVCGVYQPMAQPPAVVTTATLALPYDPLAAEALKKKFNEIRWRNLPPADGLEQIRNGLLATTDSTPLLRWVGAEYLLNKSPQNPQAIALMVDASASTDSQVRTNAVVFGLLRVQPKTAEIFQAIATAALASEDPLLLAGLAELTAPEREQLLAALQPALNSADEAEHAAAQARAKIIRGELDAHAWAREEARKRVQAQHADLLEPMREKLASGSSAVRLAALGEIHRRQLTLIMDESFIPAYEAAADDPDVNVRGLVARQVGEDFIDQGQAESPASIALMLKLTRDADPRVRTQALRSGLAPVRNKDRAVVERLLELRIAESNEFELLDLIDTSLQQSLEHVRAVLTDWMNDVEQRPMRAVLGFGLWQQIVKSDPPASEALDTILYGPESTIAGLAQIDSTEKYHPDTLDELFSTLNAALPPQLRDRVATVGDSAYPVLLLEKNEVDTAKEALSRDGRLKLGRVEARSAMQILKIAEGFRPPSS